MENNKKLKLIGYCRVSTDNQREDGTISLQIKDIEKFTKQNNYELVKTFCDDGVSGSKEWYERPGMLELFNYLDTNKSIDGIIIYRLDRLARDLRIQENLLYDLQEKRKKKIISISEPDLDSKDITRVLFRQMISSFSQYEKGLITMRMMNGRLKKAERGGYAGGSVPTGYVAKNKELKIDKNGAEIIRNIFKMKKKKMSLRNIVKELNKKGVKTARGGKWYAGTIRYILNNNIYKGRMNYNCVSVKTPKLSLI